MIEISIKVIPHNTQRYDTVGDWYWDIKKKKLNIFVSEMGDWKYEALVGLHEAVEALLCKDRNIHESDVSAFDILYEAQRNPLDLISEPGDCPDAPYRKEHFFATNVERLISEQLQVNWSQYEKVVQSL